MLAEVEQNELMDKDYRQVFAEALITFTDPLIELDKGETFAYTYQETISRVEQLSNKIDTPSKKLFSFGNQNLDGMYSLPNKVDNGEIGIWSDIPTKAPDDFIYFFPEMEIKIKFRKPRTIAFMRIVGDPLTGNYPTKFRIEIDVGEWINPILYFRNMKDNGNAQLVIPCSYTNVSSVAIAIEECSIPGDFVRVTDFGVYDQLWFKGDKIISFDLLEEVHPQGTIPIGTLNANELSLVVDNSDQLWDPALIKNLFLRNRKVQLRLGVKTGNDFKWREQGIFYTTMDWKIDEASNTIALRALDVISLLDQQKITLPLLLSITCFDLLNKVLNEFNFVPLQWHLNDSLKSIIYPYVWFRDITIREALTRIASSQMLDVYVDKDGVLQISKRADVNAGRATFDVDTNIISRKFESPIGTGYNVYKLNYNTLEVDYLWPKKQIFTISYTENTREFVAPGQTVSKAYIFTDGPAFEPEVKFGETVTMTHTQVVADDRVTIAYTNIGSNMEWLPNLTIIGRPITKTLNTSIARDSSSVDAQGEIPYTLPENSLIQNFALAANFTAEVLDYATKAFYSVEVESIGNFFLNLKDVVTVPIRDYNYLDWFIGYKPFIIIRSRAHFDGTYTATYSLERTSIL